MSQRGSFRGAGRGGAYYKNLYGKPRGQPTLHPTVRTPAPLTRILGTQRDLENELKRLDGKSYGAYKDLQGTSTTERLISGVWNFDTFSVSLDRIQSDPYAPPSKARLRVPQTTAQFPVEFFKNKSRYSRSRKLIRNIAFADYITRRIHEVITSRGYADIRIDSPGQQILQRSSVLVNKEWVEARISIGLPARGRTILGHSALQLFTTSLPYVIQHSMMSTAYDLQDLEAFVQCAEDQDYLRQKIITDGIPHIDLLIRYGGIRSKRCNSSPSVRCKR
jgi:predicted ABC-class ATPase